ncbi:MAG: Gfo/Idh/MocA family protein [Bosea sp. (in: a-proteobacteria)]
MLTLPNHAGLRVAGAFDTDRERRSRFCSHWQVRAYPDFDALLADPDVMIVVNLTPPQAHFETSRRALEAGKHVYSEKPLAMAFEDAESLVALAGDKGLSLSGAPCSLLGEAAEAAWDALTRAEIGRPMLAYAEMEDGQVFRDAWRDWRSLSGAPWPGVHEFEIGCTLEHAGYYLTWLCAFFGPVKRMTAFAATLAPDKGAGEGAGENHPIANDLSIACLEHESGTVSRITCGLAAPRDRSLTITGETGVLHVADGWNTRSAVRIRRERWHAAFSGRDRWLGGLERRLAKLLPGRMMLGRKLPFAGKQAARPAYPSQMDFMRGPADQALALGEGRAPRLSADFVLHITELSLAMQNADTLPQLYLPRTSFVPLTPPSGDQSSTAQSSPAR